MGRNMAATTKPTPKPAEENPSLTRLTSSDSKNELKLSMSLDKKGRLVMDLPEGRDILEPLLKQTLSNERMTYQALAYSPARDQHILLDTEGRLISLAMTPEGFIGVTLSQPDPDWKIKPKKSSFLSHSRSTNPPSLSISGDTVTVNGKKILLPDPSLNEHLTDTVGDKTGRYRLHMKKLYRMNVTTNEWELKPTPEKKTLLTVQASGDVWSVGNDKILSPVGQVSDSLSSMEDLSSTLDDIGRARQVRHDNRPPQLVFDRKIEHYSVSKDNQAIVQLNNDDDKIQRILWLEDVRRPEERTELTLPTGYSCRKTAMYDKTVFAIDYRGRLQSCPLPSNNDPVLRFDSGAMGIRASAINQALGQTVGPGFKIDDIGHVKDGRIRLVVKDKAERKHVIQIALDREKANVVSAWNITDSLTLDRQKGLQPFVPEAKDVLNLDRLGKVSVYDSRAYFLNEKTGQWELSSEERSDRLKVNKLRCGLDGHPWMLKDGHVKRLKVRQSSNKQSLAGNVFVLPQAKKSLSIDAEMSGLDHDHHLVDFAAADSRNVMTLNKDGDLHFHTQGSNRTVSRSAIADAAGPDGLKLSGMALNKDKSLWLASESGELFRLSESQWKRGEVKLKPVELPRDKDSLVEVAALHTTEPGGILIEDRKGKLWKRDAGKWIDSTKDTPDLTEQPVTQDENFHRLHKNEHLSRIPGTNTHIKTHVSVIGMGTIKEKTLKARFRDRMDAFIFRPTLEWPRPLKNMAYGVQHAWQGREGLRPVYEMQAALTSELRSTLNETRTTIPQKPVSERLDALTDPNASEEEKKLFRDVADLKDLLATSADHYSKVIARHYGILNKDLRPTLKNQNRHTNSGRFNPSSSRATDLTKSLNDTLNTWPIDEANSAGFLVNQLVARNITINEQKENVPGGRQRDNHDDIGLVKSRLIHDALTIRSLHEFMGDMEKSLQGEDRDAAITELSERLTQIRYHQWEGNQIKSVTDQGFENHRTLEASYDAIRQMVKAFSKENHGVNLTARTVLQAKDQDALQHNITDTLMRLEEGESLAVSRSYGVNASVSSYFSKALFIGANARAGMDRGYQMQLTRINGGFAVTFGRARATSGGIAMGLSDNLAGDWDHEHPTPLNDNPHFPASKTLLVGGGVSLSARETRSNRLTLDVADRELPAFIDQLLSGELDPLQMMNRGNNHQLITGKTQDINLSLSAQASAYITMPFVSDEVDNVTAIGRVRAAAAVGVNMASMHRERTMSVTSAGSGFARTDNRLTAGDHFFAGVQASAPVGPRVYSDGSLNNATGYAQPAIDVHASIDNRTNHRLKVELTDASEINTTHIEAIARRLERHFTDNPSAQLLVNLQKKKPDGQPLSNGEKLRLLDRHFSSWYTPDVTSPPGYGARHSELIGHGQKTALLDLQRLVRQLTAFNERSQVITKAEYQSSYKNLNRLDHNSFVHYVSHFMENAPTHSNADRLKGMMEQDHQLAGFLNALRDNPHAVATVSLEFNTETRNWLEKEWANKTLTQEQITDLLRDRNRVRLKSVAFTQTAKKTDGFASPSFVLGGSNGATVSMTEHLGTVAFTYPDDDDRTPATYTLRGRIAVSENTITHAMNAAKDAGYVLRATS